MPIAATKVILSATKIMFHVYKMEYGTIIPMIQIEPSVHINPKKTSSGFSSSVLMIVVESPVLLRISVAGYFLANTCITLISNGITNKKICTICMEGWK
jgi:hypothetical protein